MPFAASLIGTIVPVLLMLAPFMVIGAQHGTGHAPATKTGNAASMPCTPCHPPLM